MPRRLEVPPTDDQIKDAIRALLPMHEKSGWDSAPMLFLHCWNGEQLAPVTFAVLAVDAADLPDAVMEMVAQHLASETDVPYLFTLQFEGRIREVISLGEGTVAPDGEAGDEILIIHSVAVDGRECVGLRRRRDGTSSVDMASSNGDVFSVGGLAKLMQACAETAAEVLKGSA